MAILRRLLGVYVLLMGCSSTLIPPPESALTRYRNALKTGDARAAYESLDERTKEDVSIEAFTAMFEENTAELRDQAAAIDAAIAEGELRSRAEVPLRSGEAVVLTLNNGEWRLVGGVLDTPALLTPMDTVLALRHALQRRNLSALLRVLARSTRGEVEADLRRLLIATEDLLDLQIDEEGDHARIQTTAGPTLILRREAAEWRIVDLEP